MGRGSRRANSELADRAVGPVFRGDAIQCAACLLVAARAAGIELACQTHAVAFINDFMFDRLSCL